MSIRPRCETDIDVPMGDRRRKALVSDSSVDRRSSLNRTRPLSRIEVVSIALVLSFVIISQFPVQSLASLQVNATSPLIYSTDFSSVTRQDAHHLNMGISNWFEFSGDGGATMWMEGLDRATPGIACHSGGRCVGMEVTDITKSRRSEFDIFPTIPGNSYFVSVWLYLPSDWQLHVSNNWYEIADPCATNGPTYLPYSSIHMIQPDLAKPVVNSNLDNRGIDGIQRTYDQSQNLAVPRGRWFNLQYYVILDPNSGTVQIWIDGSLQLESTSIPTQNTSESLKTTIAKIYYTSTDNYSPYRLWVDDLEIYNALPSSTTTSSSSTAISQTSATTTSTIVTTSSSTTSSTTTSSAITTTSSATSTTSNCKGNSCHTYATSTMSSATSSTGTTTTTISSQPTTSTVTSLTTSTTSNCKGNSCHTSATTTSLKGNYVFYPLQMLNASPWLATLFLFLTGTWLALRRPHCLTRGLTAVAKLRMLGSSNAAQ
jgi:hypothetical protein